MSSKVRCLEALGVALALVLALSGPARAVHCAAEAGGLSCTDIGGTDVGGDCTLTATTFTCTAATIINIPGSLTIDAASGINCRGANGGLGTNGMVGFALSLNVGGDLIVDGFLITDGGTGGSGGTGAPGAAGATAGNIDIDVCGD